MEDTRYEANGMKEEDEKKRRDRRNCVEEMEKQKFEHENQMKRKNRLGKFNRKSRLSGTKKKV